MTNRRLEKKHLLWAAAATAVIIVTAAAWYFAGEKENGGQKPWYRGDVSRIKKSGERKKQFLVGVSDIPETAAPLTESGQTARSITKLVYEPLMEADGEGNTAGALAESIQFDKNGRKARITLRKAAFSDGSPVDADRVIEAYRYAAGEPSVYREELLAIEGMAEYQEGKNKTVYGMKRLGDRELLITFTTASAANLKALTIPVALPAREERPYALGSGPYAIESIESQTRAVLVENPKAPNPYPYREVCFLNMPLERIKEHVEKGGLDFMAAGRKEGIKIFQEAGYFDLYRRSRTEFSYFAFSPKSKKELREAIFAGFDREEFLKDIKGGELLPVCEEKPDIRLAKEKVRGLGKKPAVRILTLGDAESMGAAERIEEQLERLGFKPRLISVDAGRYKSMAADGEGYDLDCSRSPGTWQELLTEYSERKLKDEAFQKEFLKKLSGDTTKVYSWLWDKLKEERLFLPIGAGVRYSAVSADCTDPEWLKFF